MLLVHDEPNVGPCVALFRNRYSGTYTLPSITIDQNHMKQYIFENALRGAASEALAKATCGYVQDRHGSRGLAQT